MSFLSDIKKEIKSFDFSDECCKRAFVYGCVRAFGSIGINEKGRYFSVYIDDDASMSVFLSALSKAYKTEVELSLKGKRGKASKVVNIEKNAESFLYELGILKVIDREYNLDFSMNTDIINRECCAKVFFRLLFGAFGNVAIPANKPELESKRYGYHLEIACQYEELIRDLIMVLGQYDIAAKYFERNESYVLYIKESEMISDFLAFLGANNAVLALQEIITINNVNNDINRKNNFSMANMLKSFDAAAKQILAIEKIKNNGGFDRLSPQLKEAAFLRLDNRELGLAELATLAKPPTTKSGMQHRYGKILQIAEMICI